jgi:hypothetical protein
MLRQQNFFVYVHLSIDSFRIKNNSLLSKYLFSLLEKLPASQVKPSYKICSASVAEENRHNGNAAMDASEGEQYSGWQ